jgi:hypothetical protein
MLLSNKLGCQDVPIAIGMSKPVFQLEQLLVCTAFDKLRLTAFWIAADMNAKTKTK